MNNDDSKENLAKIISSKDFNKIPEEDINKILEKLSELLKEEKLSKEKQNELKNLLENSKSKKSLWDKWKAISSFLGDTSNLMQIVTSAPKIYTFLN